jgi:hypothetical protein
MTTTDSVLSDVSLLREAARLSTEQGKPPAEARGEIPDGAAVFVGVGL